MYLCLIHIHTYIHIYQNLVVIKPKSTMNTPKKKISLNTTLKIIIKSQEKRTKEGEDKKTYKNIQSNKTTTWQLYI